jgi:vitamin B12 transporter
MPGIREGWRWLFPSARIPANAVAAPAKAAPLWRPGTVGDGGEGIYNTFSNMQVGQSLSVHPAAWAVLCAIACPSWAQPALAPTVVTAARVEQPLADVLADVTIIDRERIEQAGAQSVIDLLAMVPGVQVSSNGSYRSNSGVFLRGATSSQSILLINGVRVGSATTGAYALENLLLERVERIEVLRGASAALYGPDAIGGVIQVFTREPTSALRRWARAGLGSDGQRSLGASIAGGVDGWSYQLGATRERAQGISAQTPQGSGYNPDDDGYTYTSVDATLRYQFADRHTLSAQWLYSDGQYGFDGTPYPNPLALRADQTRALNDSRLQQGVLKWVARWSEQWTSTVTLGRSWDDSVSRYWRQSDGAFGGEGRFNTQRTQWSWQNDWRFGNDVLTLLAERRKDEVDSTTVYTVAQRTVRALAASYAWQGDDWDALATLRRDHDSQYGGFTNWAVAGGYRLNTEWRLVGSLGTAFQAPTFNQLYFPGFGNPDLLPQRGRARELGLRYQQGTTRASAVVYHNRVQGFIVPATNEQSSRAVLRGATLTWDQRWGDADLSLAYDYSDPRLQPSNARVLRVARHVWRARWEQRLGPWRPFAEWRVSSDREDSQWPGRVSLPGYGVLNLGARYSVDKHWSLLLRLNNVADKRYALANGYTMPGRNLFVALQWSDPTP